MATYRIKTTEVKDISESLLQDSQNQLQTRKYSSRMRTAHLHQLYGHSIATRCHHQCWWGRGGIEVNKFEQVFSDGHQMSQAGGGWRVEGPEVNKFEQMSLPGRTCTVRSHT